ncbi:MAG: 2-amino-4-hydroxy-6-hydroxymethyldihydropteridine diphosphokinase [Pseudomonadota bacterium]
MPDQDFLIALGGNMPLNSQPPEKAINQAVERLTRAGATSIELSPLYRTPAFPPGNGPDFVNAAAAVRLFETPNGVLDLLHEIESEMGRIRSVRWGERTIDLDLIAAGARVLPNEKTQEFWRSLRPEQQLERMPDQLILPHPRLQDRAFVLRPLCDIAPEWRHPTLDRTVRQMLFDLPEADLAAIRPL